MSLIRLISPILMVWLITACSTTPLAPVAPEVVAPPVMPVVESEGLPPFIALPQPKQPQGIVECRTGKQKSHQGEATFFKANGTGNCSFDPFTDDQLIGAINEKDYGNADYCGACVDVEGPQGKVQITIADRCPGCKPGDIDLSGAAFAAIADPASGRVPIKWKVVPCDTYGDITLRFRKRSNAHWAALQVRNHRYPIKRVEYRVGSGRYVEMNRQRYNYFVSKGMGEGPFDLRVTDIHGRALISHDLPLVTAEDMAGDGQFEECRE